jgi:hypothetical protein
VPRSKADPGRVEGRLVEAIEVKKPQAPASLVAPEWDFTPAFGSFFDLGGNGTRPASNGLAAALQDPRSRPGLLDHHPEDLLGKVGAGVTAERYIRQAQ